ncbi:MAG TPA: M56 family metallopeptidase, partial [Verrucomicrobiales bacterium]|nr:M56 family metallopeptidase [Verrucomicrobiales bacterium]
MNPPYFESFVPRAGDINWPAVLTEFTLKSSLLILTGVCLNRWMVKASAALRFRLLWLSLLGVPVLLLSSFIRPQETVPLRYPVNVFDTSASPAGDRPTVAQNEPPVASVMPDPVSDNATLSAATSTTKPAWESSILLVWLTGIFACALRMAVRLLRARRISAKWTELKDGRLFQLLAGVSTQHGLPEVPRLLVSPEWIMPCTWGWRRPVIALPREAESWTGERLLHVLHHETGHIVRKDAPAHMLAFIALWPAWFNPLALAAKRQLSILREIACDDWVVTRGKANPLCYGTDLLALVKEHVLRSPAPHAPGLAVAQPSALAKRFRRLIQADVNRTAATARGKAALIAGWIGLTVGLSMVISCRAGAPVPMAPAPPAGSGSTETKISTKVSPEKARQGAKTIRYTLIEITVPDDDRSPSFLRPLLKEGGPDLIPFDSLRSLSQTKGTDLLKSGEAKEGQRLLWKAVKPF